MLPKDAIITLNIDYILEGYEFTGWNVNGELYSKVNEITLKMPDQVDDNEVESRNLILFHLGEVRLVVETTENTAENFRMQRFHSSAKNRRIARERLHRTHCIIKFFNEIKRSARCINLNSILYQKSDDFIEISLVKY